MKLAFCSGGTSSENKLMNSAFTKLLDNAKSLAIIPSCYKGFEEKYKQVYIEMYSEFSFEEYLTVPSDDDSISFA